AAALAVVGVVLTRRMPRHRISWVMASGGLWWALGALSYAYAVEALVTSPGSLPGGVAAASIDSWAWLPGVVLFPCGLLVLMPDGHLARRRWWPVPAAAAAGCVLLAAKISTSSRFDLGSSKVSNPLETDAGVLSAAAFAGFLLVAAGLAGSLAAF